MSEDKSEATVQNISVQSLRVWRRAFQQSVKTLDVTIKISEQVALSNMPSGQKCNCVPDIAMQLAVTVEGSEKDMRLFGEVCGRTIRTIPSLQFKCFMNRQ